MSSSNELARLQFIDPHGLAKLRVADQRLWTIARGRGALTERLPAGLYRLEAQIGAARSVKLVALKDGEKRRVSADIKLSTPAPVAGTATAPEHHRAAAEAAGSALADTGSAGIAVIVREVADHADHPLAHENLATIHIATDLPNAHGSQLLSWNRQTSGLAYAVMRVPPGSYTLQAFSGSNDTRRMVGQALSVIPGHQTMVFVPMTPVGPAFDRASIHLVRTTTSWQADLPGLLQAEAILANLHIGHPLVPDFETEFIDINPMLGVLAVHALMLAPNLDRSRIIRLARLTAARLGGAPDGIALRCLERELVENVRGATVAAVLESPPMMRRGYDAILRAEIVGRLGIAPRSSAETAAEQMVNRGVWTTWSDGGSFITETATDIADEPVEFEINLTEIGSTTNATVSLSPATRRVAAYLVSVAEAAAQDPSLARESVGEQQVAWGCRLPLRRVRQAHHELTSTLVYV